ncbi:alpha/beta fold hydrolase [Streptomyces sp. NPDC059092]|uniref:alpha/beta fold hydrolase n=1 Tax=Streptomyces sp. NPDC059092 TaxID=3346725 RepID=UPI003675F3EA
MTNGESGEDSAARSVPLIDPAPRSMTLADGRCVTWQEFGVPDGRPALYFHGGGATSLEAGIFHREAVRHHVRLIAVNRPGAAGSSLRAGRRVADYSLDLVEVLDDLQVDRFACFGESNGGMMTMAAAATMGARVLGAAPINPTVPWFDPVARSVSSSSAAIGYRLIKHLPRAVAALDANAAARRGTRKPPPAAPRQPHDPANLEGPPPGIERDVGEFQLRVMTERAGKQALLAEMAWASADWGFDPYSIPAPLDFFCGVHDAQAPFALILTDRNPDARFHHFSFGHSGYAHPDARRRIVETVAGYFGQ